jgi:hypothetical protein
VASNAFTGHLVPLLRDADHLCVASGQLPGGIPARALRIAALSRAIVVTCVSAWEAYIEEVVRESLDALRPAAPPMAVSQRDCARTIGEVQYSKHRKHTNAHF